MTSLDPLGWVGSIIDGQFAVESIAGEGGFGIVYRGTHLGLETPVAIKCLQVPRHLHEEERAGLLAKFRAEARLLHQLSRETTSIVQALAVGAATAPSGMWTPYIVMEWLDGETLESDLLGRNSAGLGPRGFDEAIRILTPAAEALTIAHENDVSHRDIKPANLFLTKSRGGSRMKVLDFGIAKVFSETPSVSPALAQTTQHGRMLTPLYGAPEQFVLSLGATGPWTDVFAMALILIEVASGRRALTGATVVEIFKTSSEAYRQPKLLHGVVSESSEAAAILRRALAQRPTSRFRTMGELWTALSYASRGAPSAALAPTMSAPSSERMATALAEEPGSERDPKQRTYEPVSAQISQESFLATGENRVCTVMLIDISSVNQLGSRLAPEEVKDVLDSLFKAVTTCVQAMGGVIERLAADRITAAFGVARTTDNDAERAVLAAQQIHATIARIPLPRAARSMRPGARIGIATGRVFVGVSGDPRKPDLTVIGDPVNVAMQIQKTAPSGAIVIGRDTYRQVASRFNVEPVEAIEVPGRTEALPCFRVEHALAFRASLSPTDFHGLETRFVGRVVDKQRLLEALETVVSEQRTRMLVLVGAPGVGRSRLLAEMFSSLASASKTFLVLTAQSSPLADDTSYGLATALLRPRFGIEEGDAPSVILRKLRRGWRWFRASSAAERRLNRSSAPSRGRPGEDSDPAELDAALVQIESIFSAGAAASSERAPSSALDERGMAAKMRISAAALLLARVAAQRVPLVIFCDDAHRADDASLDLLDGLMKHGGDRPILLLCSARSELLERRPEWIGDDEAREIVHVAPLARRHIEEIIRDRLRRIDDLSPDLVRVLADRAEGNPLILEETLHLLVDAGVIEAHDEGPWAFHQARLGALTLPATIQGIVQSRIDRLEPEVREVLVQAATVGKIFWQGAIEHMRLATKTGPSAAVEALLKRLRSRQLIRPHEPPMLPGERESTFAESATHEVAYEMLSVRIRRPLHLLVAGWLEPRVSASAGAALLAFHYDRGGAAARAATAYTRAAAHAASLGENAEAIRHLERARAIHNEERGEDAERRGEGWDESDRRVATYRARIELRLNLGDALRRAGRLDDAERVYGEARAQIVRVERRPGAFLQPSEPLLWDARIDARLALVCKVRGSSKEAVALIERAIKLATEAGAADETPAMYALLAFLLRRDRRPEESWQAARTGLRICRSLPRHDEQWQENVGQLMLGVAISLFGRGLIVRAERTYRQASRMASESTHPHLVGAALNGVAGMRLRRGDARGAREALLRSMRFKERAGDLHPIAFGYSNLAEVELQLKEIPSALEHARRGVLLGEQVCAGSDLADMYGNLAEAELAAGELAAALATGRKALAIAEVSGRVYLGHVAVTLARVVARVVATKVEDKALYAKAEEVAASLGASLAKHFDDNELRAKADECRAILSGAGMKIESG